MSEDAETRTFEYLLVLDIPKGAFYSSLLDLKKLVKRKYDCKKAKVTQPHITLLVTCLHESREERYIQFLKEISEYITPFDISPTNCKGYQSNLVVYVDVKDKLPIQAIVKRLRGKLNRTLKRYQSFSPRYCSDPHITIAKDMDKADYEMALAELKSVDHNFEYFHVGQMILLKKRLGIFRHEVIGYFEFLGKTEARYVQGELF